MTDIVTGTPAVVGFTDGQRHYGLSSKDALFMSSLNANESTRDVLQSLTDVVVSVEKNGAANSLATEKIGAAASLAIEKVGSASVLAVWEARSQMQGLAAQLSTLGCEIKQDIADVKATVLAVDASRIRDELREAQNELLLIKTIPGSGSGMVK